MLTSLSLLGWDQDLHGGRERQLEDEVGKGGRLGRQSSALMFDV